jgi:CRP/FNR family transcriptional regulator, cyclic AMP receptor protein
MQVLSAYHGWESVCGLSEYQQLPANTVVLLQGTTAQHAILLVSGWVKLTRQEQDGKEQIIALCPPMSLLGAEALIAEQPYPSTAMTLSSCQFYLIPAPVFLNWIRTDLQFSWQIKRAFSRRINAMDVRSTQQRGIPSRLRLEQLLWQLVCAQNYDVTGVASKYGRGEKRLLLPLQRQELAQLISVTPEYLSRLLGKMEKERIIRREKGWLIVPDHERLWRTPEIHTLTESNPIELGLPDLIIA